MLHSEQYESPLFSEKSQNILHLLHSIDDKEIHNRTEYKRRIMYQAPK